MKLENIIKNFHIFSIKKKYTYNFSWLGRPIIQYPQDILAMQELIWNIKPDLIIETGIAHGGSLIFYASILEMIGKGEVVGIDIEIRENNKKAIEEHNMFKRITMIEDSSISENALNQVKKIAQGKKSIILCLDSSHTHDHVLQELRLYSSLIKKDNYIIVFDTSIDLVPNSMFKNRPWNKKNNPKTALEKFLQENDRFIIDKSFNEKLLITANQDGYLKCIKDQM